MIADANHREVPENLGFSGRSRMRENVEMVDRAGFEPAYGKPGQIYSLPDARRKPPFMAIMYGLCIVHL